MRLIPITKIFKKMNFVPNSSPSSVLQKYNLNKALGLKGQNHESLGNIGGYLVQNQLLECALGQRCESSFRLL